MQGERRSVMIGTVVKATRPIENRKEAGSMEKLALLVLMDVLFGD